MIETLLYFAYGSNMSSRRLRAVDRAPTAKFLSRATLKEYRLVFDKVSEDGSAKADGLFTGREEDVLQGALYSVARADFETLDLAEGVGLGYDVREIEVDTVIGKVGARVYIATLKATGLLPYTWYIRHVVEGAREIGLPTTYVEAIERTPAIRDPSPEREARELSVY